MVGKVYLSVVEYYDSKTKTTRKKGRPVLVVAGPRNNDYTVLPISTIKRREHLDSDYDIPIETNIRAGLALSEECFIRTHKQTTVHMGALIKQKGDMKNDYPDLYLTALQKWKSFSAILWTMRFEISSPGLWPGDFFILGWVFFNPPSSGWNCLWREVYKPRSWRFLASNSSAVIIPSSNSFLNFMISSAELADVSRLWCSGLEVIWSSKERIFSAVSLQERYSIPLRLVSDTKIGISI